MRRVQVPAADEVHVWLVPVACADAVAPALDQAERERAARFRSEAARRLYITAHGGLRLVLGRYLGVSPSSLRFGMSDTGKPCLAGGVTPTMAFNLSHSGTLAAVAAARGREVGVDVEHGRPVRAEAGVARRVMTPDELARYHALDGDAARDFLLWVWARKEALLKASGEGVRRSLAELPCEPGPDDRWTVVDLPVPGYAAAVAAEGRGWSPVLCSLDVLDVPDVLDLLDAGDD